MAEEAHTFALSNLGCKANQVDGQIMRERMAALGWREVEFQERADLYIINTCTVTGKADDKCRKETRRAVRRNPEARVIVTGCGAVSAAAQFEAIDGVSAVFTRERMANIDTFLEQGATPESGEAFEQGITYFAGHTRAFLRIQDGCEAHCTYCIVPRVRGPMRSRAMVSIRREAARLIAAGHIEIVLTGIHVGRYGAERDEGPGLADAVAALLETHGLERLRISSIEVLEITPPLLELAASERRFCPHFHLPLQSGDDAILRAMRRAYTVRQYLETIERIRLRLDRPALTTDVMVGFPGETEARFERTLAVCREAGFSRIHIFPFSSRPGAPAADMPGKEDGLIVKERVARLKELAAELALEYKGQFINETIEPLVEHRRDPASGRLAGWSARYLRTGFEGGDDLMGKIVPVCVAEISADGVLGRRV